MRVESVTFGVAAIAFAALFIASISVWRERTRGSWLGAALLTESLRCALIAAASAGGETTTMMPASAVVAAEALRGIAWIAFLARALGPLVERDVPRLIVVGAQFTAGATLGVALLAPLLVDPAALGTLLGDLRRWSGLMLAIVALVLVEQFARNAREGLQWSLRYLWLGIGLAFAHDLCLWSIALLVNDVGELLAYSRGAIAACVALLFAVALRRVAVLGAATLRTSGALFFNSTLVITGCYVLLMALASWVLRALGGAGAPLVEAIFFGASLVVLAVAAFSDQFRAWFRVTIAKSLGLYRYDYREQWLRLTRALAPTAEQPLHDRVASVVAALVNGRSGALYLRDAEDAFVRVGGALAPQLPERLEAGEFLRDLVRREWIFDLQAARAPGAAPRETATPAGHAAPPPLLAAPEAWLVVPLVCNGEGIGCVVIGRALTPTPLGWEQLDVLRVAGRQVASHLAFEQAQTRLAEMHQFATLNRLSGFVMHDLRHLVAQLALVVDNAARHRTNPAFIDDAMLTIEGSVERMNRLMEVLRSGAVQEPLKRVELVDLCREVAARCAAREPAPRLELAPPAKAALEVMANRERLAQALEHLVRNAQDATGAGGSVSIRVGRKSHSTLVEIVDTGSGMDAEFIRTRLFKPFDSTKRAQGMGLGAYEAREIVRGFGGSLAVLSTPGAGSCFSIELPLAAADRAR